MENQSVFEKRFMKMLAETMSTGSAGIGAGSNSVFSKDSYATGDTRIPFSIFGGHVITRSDISRKKGKSRKRRKRK